jgi:hypothetical protein
MLAMALLSLSLSAGTVAPPSVAHDGPAAVGPQRAAPAPAQGESEAAPDPEKAPAGVVPDATFNRLRLDRSRLDAQGAATQDGAADHPARSCSIKQARAGRCLRAPSGKASTRIGKGTNSDEQDSAPSTTSP